MSEVMITGDTARPVEEGSEWSTIEAGLIVHARGLGLIDNAVIDQHFLARRRQNRLISLVLEMPTLVGAGIDEATAILVRPGGQWEVLGESQVFVVDAREARISKDAAGRLSASGLALHLLLAGDLFDPATGRVAAREERP
jgi:cyanophycinase